MSIKKVKSKSENVVISKGEYNSLKETIYLLSGKNGDVLRDSIKELDSKH